MSEFGQGKVKRKKENHNRQINPGRGIDPGDYHLGKGKEGVEGMLRNVGPGGEFGAQRAVRKRSPEDDCSSFSIDSSRWI